MISELPNSSCGEVGPPSFQNQLIALCDLLEQWRAECLAEKLEPDEFPEMNGRKAAQGFVFYGVTGSASWVHSWTKDLYSTSTSLIVFVVLVISLIMGTIVLLDSWGIFTAQFWKATGALFRRKEKKPDNYPFAHLKQRLEKDFDGAARLKPFPDAVLLIAKDRFAADETELRDRLTMLFGGAPIVMFVGLLAALWTSWQSFQQHFNLLTSVILSTSVLVIFLSAFGVKFRVALFELTRARAMINLELARRKHADVVKT